MKIKKKKLRVLTYYKQNWPVPYIVFSFQLPTKVVYPQPEHAKVLCRTPVIGQYLYSDINGSPLPYIDFLPLGRTTPGTHCFTKIVRVRLNIGHLDDEDLDSDSDIDIDDSKTDIDQSKIITDWNLDSQPVILMEKGIVFGIVEVCLNKEYLWIESNGEHPIILKGAFEST